MTSAEDRTRPAPSWSAPETFGCDRYFISYNEELDELAMAETRTALVERTWQYHNGLDRTKHAPPGWTPPANVGGFESGLCRSFRLDAPHISAQAHSPQAVIAMAWAWHDLEQKS